MLHCAPPSTVRIVPVVKLEASLARYNAAPTISSASPARRMGNVRARSAKRSMSHVRAIVVRNGPGMIALTRTRGPNAWASPTVMAFTPAFAAAYGTMSRVGRTAPVLETLMIEPPRPSAIRSPTSAASRNGPFRLTPITLSKSSSLTSLSFA